MRETPPTKKCSRCGEEKDRATAYYHRSQGGKRYPEARCKPCSIIRTGERKAADPEYAVRYRATAEANSRAKEKKARATDVNRAIHVAQDCRNSDAKKGWKNDLTKSFVEAILVSPCAYCDHRGRMTLDRIDNALPHVQSNVVPACVPCNMTRSDMPYATWLIVSEGMKKAREMGLFEGWMPRGKRA